MSIKMAYLGLLLFSMGCSSGGPKTSSNPGPVTFPTEPLPLVATPGMQVAEGQQLNCDVVVVGGGLGGTSASLAACAVGAKVVVIEPTDWLGGQLTSQGLNCSDDSFATDTFGASGSYQRLRGLMRRHYGSMNPGNCWVSNLCAEPRVALAALAKMTETHSALGLLQVIYNAEPVEILREGIRVLGVRCRTKSGTSFTVLAPQTIDATELGDGIRLAGAEYRLGQEARSDTGEQDAPLVAVPNAVQAFTYCFVLERRPAGENHVIPKPAGYMVDPWMMNFHHQNGPGGSYVVPYFESMAPVWTYRRILEGQKFGGEDLSLQNWGGGNDYYWGSLLDPDPIEVKKHLDRAKQRALGYLYWLQTEAEGKGFPNLRFRQDVMGTSDGFPKFPYIRESRRLRALSTIKVEDISDAWVAEPRARTWEDSVGIGHYGLIDLHRSSAPGSGVPSGKPLPFQVPMGALIPQFLDGLLAGAKNIGTTHLSNGAYRLQPVEWTIGEAAGALAAYCAKSNSQPREVWASDLKTLDFQRGLVTQGVPIYWMSDPARQEPGWQTAQLAMAHGLLPANPSGHSFNPEGQVTEEELVVGLGKALNRDLTSLGNGLLEQEKNWIQFEVGASANPASLSYLHELLDRVLGANTANRLLQNLPPTSLVDRALVARVLLDAMGERGSFSQSQRSLP